MAIEEKIPRATHTGELKIGEMVIPCAVLEDGTRLISERGITKALGAKRGGAHWRRKKAGGEGADLPVFASSPNLIPYIDLDLADSLLAPKNYLSRTGQKVGYGREATILPKICDVWLRARDAGALHPTQLHIAHNADILMRSLAQVGIIALVDEATGYQKQRDQDELQRFLELYLSEERLKWAKMFPDEYYKQLFRLQGWIYSPISVKRPKLVGILTNKLVYEKLPANVLDKLRRLNPVKNKRTWRWEATFFQHLSADIGQPDLRDHLLQLIAIMRASPNWGTFKRLFARAFPGPGGRQLEMIEEHEVETIDI